MEDDKRARVEAEIWSQFEQIVGKGGKNTEEKESSATKLAELTELVQTTGQVHNYAMFREIAVEKILISQGLITRERIDEMADNILRRFVMAPTEKKEALIRQYHILIEILYLALSREKNHE